MHARVCVCVCAFARALNDIRGEGKAAAQVRSLLLFEPEMFGATLVGAQGI